MENLLHVHTSLGATLQWAHKTIRVRKLLYVTEVDCGRLSQVVVIDEVFLVPHDDHWHTVLQLLGEVILNLSDPELEVRGRLDGGDVIDNDDGMSVGVETVCDRLETLLTCMKDETAACTMSYRINF